jgi:Protein of unknown function (DUF3224)
MSNMNFKLYRLMILALMLLSSVVLASGQVKKKPKNLSEKMTTKHATGTFEVKVAPVKDDEASAVEGIGRLSLNKTWTGDLVGTSKGQMLGSSDESQSTGGYVAMEVFTGTLNGKKGSFAMQHNGTMGGGNFDINVEVVPGSGTEELKGISGKLKIIIADRKHSYELAYSLPDK